MKILAVAGSCRLGNTKYLVDVAVAEIVNTYRNLDITNIHLKDISMNFCCGCLDCDSTGKCIYSDDMTDLVSIARDADGLILATPARWGLLSGEMKTFLDRLNPLAVREELNGKKAIVIAVGQSEEDDSESIRFAAESLVTFCNNAGICVLDTVMVCGCYSYSDASTNLEAITACKSAGKHLLNNIQS